MGAEISEEDGEYADTSVPVWARSCVGAMLTLGIFDRADVDSAEENLTRADLASYLYRMTVLI